MHRPIALGSFSDVNPFKFDYHPPVSDIQKEVNESILQQTEFIPINLEIISESEENKDQKQTSCFRSQNLGSVFNAFPIKEINSIDNPSPEV